MKIHEMVVMYIDADEKSGSGYPYFKWPSGEAPTFSTFDGISKKYCFLMRGGGRAGGRRYSCWCDACCCALFTGDGIDELLHVANCKRRHLSQFKEGAITCKPASGQRNARAWQQEIWIKIKPLLRAGKFAAIQARELWSTEERIHLRPGHFWVCELGEFDGKGSPIIHTFTQKNEYFELSNGQKVRGDAGDCLMLLRRYYHRVADDREGLTFVRWQEKNDELLVVNSSELRAVQGWQECDFLLTPPHTAVRKRASLARSNKKKCVEVQYDNKTRWLLEGDLDRKARKLCEHS